MVINVLVNSFDTHGNTPQKSVISSLPMMKVHAKENSMNVMSNLSRIHSLTRTFSMRITMLSGLQLVSNRNDDSCPSGGSAPVEHQCC